MASGHPCEGKKPTQQTRFNEYHFTALPTEHNAEMLKTNASLAKLQPFMTP